MASAGKKRASPGADEEKNLFDVEISDEHNETIRKVNEEILRAEIANDRDGLKRLEPVFQKRRELLKTIPKFWPVSMMNNPDIALLVQHTEDQKALLYLEDLYVARDPAEFRAFTIEFHFAENPYFSDKVLKKEYKFIPPPAAASEKPDEHGITDSMVDFSWERDVAPQKISISWKSDAKKLTKLHPVVKDSDGDVQDRGSFFNLFETEEDADDIGVLIANEVFPNAIDFFTGTASADIDSELDSEEDDDDEDAEEIDLEKPEPKRARRN